MSKPPFSCISDSQAPSGPSLERRQLASPCGLARLPDELITLVAENLVDVEEADTFVYIRDNHLEISHPEVYQNLDHLVSGRPWEALTTEFEKALHKDGIIAFEDEEAFMSYFDPELLEIDKHLSRIRLATQRVRFMDWNGGHNHVAQKVIRSLRNLTSVHLGGVWTNRYGGFKIHPAKRELSEFEPKAKSFAAAICPDTGSRPPGRPPLRVTFGPGRFGENTVGAHDCRGDRWALCICPRPGSPVHCTFWSHGQPISRCECVCPMEDHVLCLLMEPFERKEKRCIPTASDTR
ncbi:uncharacterized protein BKCO1_6000053 [Diplodia corticola]|uniref:Uncharacterized protein n=1 Tax=Diplodia corticola TaxID=236234 RepID=A0A1J9RD64_9PEZI|nr:uncharacterized protein BKCO1_6000053 [Diplodia corticola]OJD30459.1 hypothetical protein BKCO1_6000053 [Diplodia corticola]